MSFVSPRSSTNVEILFKNKNFSYDKNSTPKASPASSILPKRKGDWDPDTSWFSFGYTSPVSPAKIRRNNEGKIENAAVVKSNDGIPRVFVNFSSTDYDDYDPVDVIPLPKRKLENNRPLFMQVVANHFDFVNNFQLILVAYESHLELYSLESLEDNPENVGEAVKVKGESDGKKGNKTDLMFSLKKLQESSDVRSYGVQIQCCALSHLSCVSSANKRVMYAFAVLGSETFFLVRQESTNLTKDIDICNNHDLVAEIVTQNRCAVTHLAFNYSETEGINEEFLAVLDDGRMCTVLDVQNELTFATFSLKSPGVSVSFHPSEPYKLMIVEMSGLITIFNVAKQSVVQSINLCTRLINSHWSPANPVIVAVASLEECFIVDLSKPYATAASKKIPFSGKAIKKIEFSQADPSVMAYLGQPGIEIKVFKNHEKLHTWAKTDVKIVAAAWLVGMPYLLVLSRDHFEIYDSASR